MSGFDEMVERMRFESQRLMDGPVEYLQRLVVAELLSDAADVMEKQAQLVDRLAEECKAWMNGVADVVEPLGYDRVAACGPSDLLPGVWRPAATCTSRWSPLSAQLDAARLNEIKPIAGPPDATDVELDSVGSSCDWGGCNAESVGLRWSPKFAGYLPVCERHQGPGDRRSAPSGSQPPTEPEGSRPGDRAAHAEPAEGCVMAGLIVFIILTAIFVAGVKFTEPQRETPRTRPRWHTRKPR